MEENTGIQDWELLQNPEASTGRPKVSEAFNADSDDGAIKDDYFALDSNMRHPRAPPSETESEEGSIDSDNPSWVDPDSDSRYSDRPRGHMGLAGMELTCRNSDGFWSDEASDGQRSVAADSQKSELGDMGDSTTEVGSDGIEPIDLNSGGDGVIGGSEGADMRQEKKQDELGPVELVKMREGADLSTQMTAAGDDSSNLSAGEGDNKGKNWWKMPFELLKFCVFRARPIWSISIAAAAFVGFFMLGRRLYKMKHKSRSVQFKIAIDDKKVSHLMARAARLNEAFSVVKRVPILRPALPAGGGVTPWPAMSLR